MLNIFGFKIVILCDVFLIRNKVFASLSFIFIFYHKQVLAIQHEKEAATPLNQIESGIKVILHFDATSCSKIEGDWPCLILIFSDKCQFPLQPLFFAYEDQARIIRLIVEMYK